MAKAKGSSGKSKSRSGSSYLNLTPQEQAASEKRVAEAKKKYKGNLNAYIASLEKR